MLEVTPVQDRTLDEQDWLEERDEQAREHRQEQREEMEDLFEGWSEEEIDAYHDSWERYDAGEVQ